MTADQYRKGIGSFRSALILAFCITLGSITISIMLSSGGLRTAISDAAGFLVYLVRFKTGGTGK